MKVAGNEKTKLFLFRFIALQIIQRALKNNHSINALPRAWRAAAPMLPSIY
jgi:hypothetical protein